MRGTAKTAIAFVFDEDKVLPKAERTTFWITPWGGMSGASIAARYAHTETVDKKGYNKIHVARRIEADEQTWVDIIDHVDNFAFSYDFSEKYSKVANEKGFVKTLNKRDELIDVAKDMTLDQFNEIIEFASNVGRMPEMNGKK